MNTIEFVHFISQQRKAFWTITKETCRKNTAVPILIHLLNNAPILTLALLQSV